MGTNASRSNESGPIFTRTVNKGFKDEAKYKVDCFMDNIIIHSEDFQKRLYSWQRAYEVAHRNNFKYKPSKTVNHFVKVKVLGYIVSAEGRRIHSERLKEILEISEPRNFKEIFRVSPL